MGGSELNRFDVIIVGGGPAGSAAAIQLATRAARLAARTLLLDKHVFPRSKLCGGGVVRQADRYLSYLGIRVEVPSVPIHALRFEYEGGHSLRVQANAFRVVRREDFDQALLNEAKARGVRVQEGEGVTKLQRIDGGVRVITSQGEYEARVILGADGANSLVRRTLVPSRKQQRFVALEVFTPRVNGELAVGAEHTAVFDFRPAAQGLRGYYWDFPSLCEGEPRMNRGIGGSTWPGPHSLRTLFDAELAKHAQPPTNGDLQGSTIPMYDPSLPQSAAHVVLAGDAVGADPWLGEGISIAIGTGIVAAHATVDAFERNDFSFTGHHRRIRESALGKQLRLNRVRARRVYAGKGNLAQMFAGGGSA